MTEQGSDTRRKLLSRSAFIFAIRFFPAAATLAVQIAFSHLVNKELNGIYQQLLVYLSVLTAVACFGMPSLLLTHTPISVHRWLLGLKARHMAMFGLWLSVLAAVLVLAFRRSPEFDPGILVSLFALQAGALLLETYLMINRKFVLLASWSILYALLFCAAHYLFLSAIVSFTGLLWIIAGISLARLCVLAISARSTFHAEAAGLRRRIMSRAIRKQWAQLGIYDMSQIAFRYIDKVLISWIVGPALFSVYFNGTIDVPFIPLLLGAAGGGLLMQMASGDNSVAARLKLVNHSGSVLACIVFPVFFFLFFFRYEFIEVVFSKRYLEAVPLFAISVMALPLRAYNYTSILQHLNKVKTINWGAALDLGIALSLAYPLFLWKGLPGVAFAFMISSYIQAIFYLAKTARYMRCPILQLIPWKQWLVMLIVFGTAGIVLHDVLGRYFSDRLSLLLGFLGTTAIIAAALSPLIFSRKKHG